MIKTMMITNNVEIAKYAVSSGVDRIFVDLEINGKYERQGHLDTVISRHTMLDVINIRESLPDTELLVRLNPLYEGTKREVNAAIEYGADILMLPMFYSEKELSEFCNIVAGRVKVMPLIETPQAMVRLNEIVKVKGVSEVYIGLNDLHLALGLDFMFEILGSGLVDYMVNIIENAGLPFGFGGIARIGEGELPSEMVLSEHVRLGSSSVILSRSFHKNISNVEQLKERIMLEKEIMKIREKEAYFNSRNKEQIKQDCENVRGIISTITSRVKQEQGV